MTAEALKAAAMKLLHSMASGSGVRELRAHRAVPENERVTIFAPPIAKEPTKYAVLAPDGNYVAKLEFQNGPVMHHGTNGLSNEMLLAIVADRLFWFQGRSGAPCKQNQDALEHVSQALELLHERTRDRLARGVEGQRKP